jgi:thymidylate synthase (FAD)
MSTAMKNGRIDVLDHGFVRLVDSMGDDLSVVRAARVSYDAAWRAGEDQGSDKRLIGYLWKHRHTSPFEAVTFTFKVKAPIFAFRQWMRHRTWSYNELSARAPCGSKRAVSPFFHCRFSGIISRPGPFCGLALP